MARLDSFDDSQQALMIEYVEKNVDILDSKDEWALLMKAIKDYCLGNTTLNPMVVYAFLVEEMGQENFIREIREMKVDKTEIDQYIYDAYDDINIVQDLIDWWEGMDHDGPSDFICVLISKALPNVDPEVVFIWYVMVELFYRFPYSFEDTFEYLDGYLKLNEG